MPTTNERLRRKIGSLRRKGIRLNAWQGDFDGNVGVTGRDDLRWYRVERGSRRVLGQFRYSTNLAPTYNLPVVIELDPVINVLVATGTDGQSMVYRGDSPSDPIATYRPHAITHAVGGGDELRFVHTLQIYPNRVQPATTQKSILVYGGPYVDYDNRTFGWKSDTEEIDLTDYYPASGTKYVLIYRDSAGDAQVQDDSATTVDDVNIPPPGGNALALVRLRFGEDWSWPHDFLADVRFIEINSVDQLGSQVDQLAAAVTDLQFQLDLHRGFGDQTE